MKSYIIVATASGFSFVSFTTEEIMSVVHFKTVISAVIGTNIQVFFFWQELFVPAIALASVFFLLVKDERKYLFYRLFETYLSNTDGANQKSMTAKRTSRVFKLPAKLQVELNDVTQASPGC